MKPPIPIADDYVHIARRLKEIEQENHHQLKLELPNNIAMVTYGSLQHTKLGQMTSGQLAKYELCFILRNRDLKLVRSRTGKFSTSDGFNVFEYLKQYFPSASIVIAADAGMIRFSEDDAQKLAKVLANV